MPSLLLRSGTILTMNDRMDIVSGDVAIRDGRIEAVGRVDPDARFDRVMDVGGGYVLPGLIHSSLPDALSRFRRRSATSRMAAAARLADGSGAQRRIVARRRRSRGA